MSIRFRGMLAILMVTVAVFACARLRAAPDKLTDQDKAEIVRMTLREAFPLKRGDGIPDEGLLFTHDSFRVVVSSQNVNPRWIPKTFQAMKPNALLKLDENDHPPIITIQFDLLPPKAIQQKADREGDFTYLSFKPLKLEKGEIKVGLDNAWAVGKNGGKNPKGIHLSGGGFTLTFYRHPITGKWSIRPQRDSWIS